MSSDDRKRCRSSALFLAKSPQADTALADVSNHDRSAEASRSPGRVHASSATPNLPGDGLFVADRLSAGHDELLGMFRMLSIVIACLSVRPGRGGQSTE
jgi:hypothetical protein